VAYEDGERTLQLELTHLHCSHELVLNSNKVICLTFVSS